MDKRKQIIMKIAAVFLTIVVLLGFFSTTIYNFGLASVTIAFPTEGSPIRTLRAHGTVKLNTVFGSFAPIEGIITMNCKAGEIIGANKPLYTITPEDGGEPVVVSYEYSLAVEEFYTETNAFVNKHDKIMQVGRVNGTYYTELILEYDDNITSRGAIFLLQVPELVAGVTMYGNVKTAVYRDGVKIAKTLFEGNGLVGGEYIEAYNTMSHGLQNAVIPNTAIHTEMIENEVMSYVYSVVRQRGSFGYDYVIRKDYVYVSFKGDTSSVLYGNASDYEYPIVVNSDRPIEPGQRVKITDGNGSGYVDIR